MESKINFCISRVPSIDIKSFLPEKLKSNSQENNLTFLTARSRGVVVGVSVFRCLLKTSEKLRINWIFVPEKFRRNGIGKQMLVRIESWGRSKGIEKIIIDRNAQPSKSALDQLLMYERWEPPFRHSVRHITSRNAADIDKLSWFSHVSCDANLTIKPWSELPSNMIEQHSKNTADFVPKWANFQTYGAFFFPPTSVALLDRDKVVGWFLGVLDGHDFLNYRGIYILENYRRSSNALALTKEMILLHRDHPSTRHRAGVFITHYKNRLASNSIERRIRPIIVQSDETLRHMKTIQPDIPI